MEIGISREESSEAYRIRASARDLSADSLASLAARSGSFVEAAGGGITLHSVRGRGGSDEIDVRDEELRFSECFLISSRGS